MERVSLKLKRLVKCLQSWGHKEVGNVNVQLGLAREVLHRPEIAQDSRIFVQEGSLVVEKAETTLPCPGFLAEDSCTSEVTDSIFKRR